MGAYIILPLTSLRCRVEVRFQEYFDVKAIVEYILSLGQYDPVGNLCGANTQ